MKDFSKKIIEIIKKDHIVPESRFKLNWKNYLFWLAFSGILILGALSLSLIILNLTDLRSEIFRHLELRKFFFLIFITMPYLWIILLLVTVFSGFMVFRKTKRGYRYNILFVAGIIVLLISILGILAHFSKINSRIGGCIPGFNGFVRPMEGRWQRPGEGLLGGEIIEVEEGLFVLRIPRGEDWHIFYSNKTERGAMVEIKQGEVVGVIGEKKGEYLLDAFAIINLPFDGFHGKRRNQDIAPCFNSCRAD